MSISSRPQFGEMLAAARSYAARGWKVIPVHSITRDGSCTCGDANCRSIGKHPTSKNWPKKATSNPASIEESWKKAHYANVGIATGSASGIFVVDLDGIEGIAAFKAIAQEHGTLPPTYTVITGSGGHHLYFRCPIDRIIRNRTKINGQPIDVRGNGGQVLAPPSLHRSGGTYTVDNDIEPAEAPAWLLDVIAPFPPSAGKVVAGNSVSPSSLGSAKRSVSASDGALSNHILAYLAACPPAIEGQSGHNQAFSVANALIHGFGLTADEAFPYLTESNEICQPPWEEKELIHKLNEAVNKGGPLLGKRRGYLIRDESKIPKLTSEAFSVPQLEPWIPFPIDALPEPVRGFVKAAAKDIVGDPSYLALPLLAMFASAIGNTRRLEIKQGWIVPPILWCAIIGESGSAKSPAFRLAMRPIREKDRIAQERHAEAMKQYEVDYARWEKCNTIWKRDKKASGDPPVKPEPPSCERFFVSDTTVEALASILLTNPRGLLLGSDELNVWFGSFDRYVGKGKSGSDSCKWLSMYDADGIIVDRKTVIPRTIHIPQAAMCICGGIQPGILRRAVGDEHRENRLAARFLLACPPRKVKKWCEAEIDPRAEVELARLVDRLFDLQPITNDEGDIRPALVRLTPDAKEAWIAYYNVHGDEQANLTGDMAAAWSKLEEYAARLALVIHFIRWASNDVSDELLLDSGSMKAGIELAIWFKREADRVYTMLSETNAERDERRLIEWIERKGGSVTVRDTQQGCRWLKATGAAEAALKGLVETGRGAWMNLPSGPTGGRSSKEFVLNTGLPSTKPEGHQTLTKVP